MRIISINNRIEISKGVGITDPPITPYHRSATTFVSIVRYIFDVAGRFNRQYFCCVYNLCV